MIIVIIMIIVGIAGFFSTTLAVIYRTQLLRNQEARDMHEFKSDFQRDCEAGRWNIYYVRKLEREIYGRTFTGMDGEPEEITPQEEYYSTHDKRPMADPQPIPYDKYGDYEYGSDHL